LYGVTVTALDENPDPLELTALIYMVYSVPAVRLLMVMGDVVSTGDSALNPLLLLVVEYS
jgi:hypothetical protein